MSTFFNAKYARSSFVKPIIINGNQEINYLDPSVYKALQNVTNYQLYTFSDKDKLVNISYQAYNTTSAWWLILMYNGYLHPYEIPNGTTLKIPSLFDLTSNLYNSNSNIGQVVTL